MIMVYIIYNAYIITSKIDILSYLIYLPNNTSKDKKDNEYIEQNVAHRSDSG